MRLRNIAVYILVLLFPPSIAAGLSVEEQKRIISSFQKASKQGLDRYKKSKYEDAAKYWQKALSDLNKFNETEKIKGIKDGLYLNIGNSYRQFAKKEDLNTDKYLKAFKTAEDYYKMVKASKGPIKEKAVLGRCYLYNNRGERYSKQAKYLKALESQGKALTICRELADTNSNKKELKANLFRSIGVANQYLGNYKEASQNYTSAHKLWKKMHNKKEELNERANIAFLDIDMARMSGAIVKLQKLTEDYGDEKTIPVGNLYLNLGKCYYILGNYGKAKSYAKCAYDIYKKKGEKGHVRGIASANINLGLVAFEEGLYDDASDFFKKAGTIKDIDERLYSFCKSNEAVLNIIQFHETNNDKYIVNAEKILKEDALNAAEQVGDKRMVMSICNNLARIYYEKKEYDEAIKFLSRANRIAKELSTNKNRRIYEYSDICSNWGDIYLEQHKAEEAIKKFNKSIENARGLYKDQLWYAFYGLGRAYKDKAKGDIDKAIDNYKLSIEVIEDMRNLAGGSGSVGFLRNKHQVYTDLIDLLLEQWEKEKDDTKEKLRYSNMALMYLERSRLAAVKSLFEKALPGSKEMVRRKLNEIDLKIKNASDDSKLIRLKNEKASLERQLEKDDQLIQKVEMNESTLSKIIGNMDAKQLMLEFYYNDKSIYVWKLKKASDKPELYIIKRIYFDEDEDEDVDIIQDVMCLYESISDKDILLTEIYDTEEIEIFENAIYKRILSPLRIEKGKYDYITVIPYGKLWLLPFSVVGSGNQKLIDKWGINYFFSLTQQLVMAKSLGSNNLLAVGNPTMPDYISNTATSRISGIRGSSDITPDDINLDDVEFEEARNILSKVYGMKQGTMEGRQKKRFISRGQLFTQLPKAGLEVKEINDVFREIHGSSSSRFSVHDKAVNEKTLKEKVLSNDYNYMHFATHGKLVSDSPLDSFLVFSTDPDKSENNSGLLTVKEIRKDFFGALGGVRLVVLSACQTSLAFSSSESQTVNGMEFASLSGAFQSAGVSAVIASLWPVSSGATAKLMKEFYVHLLKGEPTGKALHLAQKKLHDKDCTVNVTLTDTKGGKDEEVSKKCDIEYFWAPFILLGSFN